MKRKVVFDGVILVVYLVAANPAFTGIAPHEWIGIGAFVALVAHLALGMDFFSRAFRSPRSFGRVGRALLDAALVVTLVVCAVSGIMVSATVLPAFGYVAQGYFVWDPMHALSAKILLALLMVHMVLAAPMVFGSLSKGKGLPKGERPSSDESAG